ncbi:MAG: hypothetical protein AB7U82_23030 [Blastocatellales bacterium]
MPTVTVEVPDELSARLNQVGERLPELLALSLEQPAVPARFYRDILNFLASNPTPEQIVAFRPAPEILQRLKTLLAREANGEVTLAEKEEIDEFEQIEHLMVMIKAGNLPYLQEAL